MLYRYAGYTGLTEMESLPNNIQFAQEEEKTVHKKKKQIRWIRRDKKTTAWKR